MKINILGTEYDITYKDYEDEPAFEKSHIVGYCDSFQKLICVGNINTFPSWKDEPIITAKLSQTETLRHEIVHAFLSESGLGSSTFAYDGGWSKNEEMIDWIAIQAPKMLEAFKAADCL